MGSGNQRTRYKSENEDGKIKQKRKENDTM